LTTDNLAPIPAPSPLTEWSARPFASITRRDVAELLAKIEDTRGAARATKVRAALSRLWSWAIGQGLVDLSPVAGIPKPVVFAPRDRTLDDSEITALLRALTKLERDPKTTAAAFWPAVRFILATALRREEASGLLWSEVDLDNAVLRISADRMKSARGHLVPLSPLAIEVLKARPRYIGNPYVFTSGHGKATGLSGWSKAMATITSAFADPIPPWSLHDLRRTFAAGAGKRGVRLEVIERCLAHRTGATVGGLQAVYMTYDFMAEQREAMMLWGEALTGLREVAERDL
jgi:integrase